MFIVEVEILISHKFPTNCCSTFIFIESVRVVCSTEAWAPRVCGPLPQRQWGSEAPRQRPCSHMVRRFWIELWLESIVASSGWGELFKMPDCVLTSSVLPCFPSPQGVLCLSPHPAPQALEGCRLPGSLAAVPQRPSRGHGEAYTCRTTVDDLSLV